MVRRLLLVVRVAFVFLLAAALSVTVVTGGDTARAFTPPPVAPGGSVTVGGDLSLTGVSGATAGGGELAGGGLALTGLAGAAGVALAGLGIGYGIGTGARMVWHWAFGSSHTPDGASSQGANYVTTGSITVTVSPAAVQHTTSYFISETATYVPSGTSTFFLDSGGRVCATGGGWASSRNLTIAPVAAGLAGSPSSLAAQGAGFGTYGEPCDPNAGDPPVAVAFAYLANGGGGMASNYSAVGGTGASVHLGPSAPAVPANTMRTVVSCQDGSGGISTVTAVSSAFVDDGVSPLPDMPVPACPVGTIPVSGVTYEDGGPSSATAPGPAVLTVSTPSWWTQYPRCTMVGADCGLTTATGTGGDTSTATAPASCGWGPYSVPLTFCTTPDPSASSSPSASASPSTSPTGGASTTPMPTPTVVDPFAPDGPSTSGNGNDCFPHGWAAFNPVEWVYKPVMCALMDAFVPKATVVEAQYSRVRTAFDASAPGTAIGLVNDTFAAFTGIGGSGVEVRSCDGPELDDGSGGIIRHWHPFSACNAVGQYLAPWCLALTSGALYFGTLVAVVRVILRAVNVDTPLRGGVPYDGIL